MLYEVDWMHASRPVWLPGWTEWLKALLLVLLLFFYPRHLRWVMFFSCLVFCWTLQNSEEFASFCTTFTFTWHNGCQNPQYSKRALCDVTKKHRYLAAVYPCGTTSLPSCSCGKCNKASDQTGNCWVAVIRALSVLFSGVGLIYLHIVFHIIHHERLLMIKLIKIEK